jgi:hypothetical protein
MPAYAASDTYSANNYLPGCIEGINANPAQGRPYTILSARCLGVLEGLGAMGGTFNLFCPPATTNTTQWMRVVVSYIEARPERMHEDFRHLAVEALTAAWPCNK